MFSFVITKEKILSGVAILALILLCVIYFFTYFKADNLSSKYEIKNTDKERRIFIESFGHTLKEDKPEVNRITIPSEFNDTYLQFEALQNEMGLSLEKFKGENVTKYTYSLTDGESYAELYIYNGKFVVAGCIVNPDLKNGYIKSLI